MFAQTESQYKTEHTRDKFLLVTIMRCLEVSILQKIVSLFIITITTLQSVLKIEIDILLVVNMFLTGFDGFKAINTLYVDKNLRHQIYSPASINKSLI